MLVSVLLEANYALAQSAPLTGSYVRHQPDEGQLKLEQLSSDKLKFDISASHQNSDRAGDVNTGSASGVAYLKNNVATYEDKELHDRIKFIIQDKKIIVSGGSQFCGLNVSLEGAYIKANNNSKSIEQINYEAADAQLNTVYKKVSLKYKNDSAFLQKLLIAEKAWIAFRDAHVDSRFSGKNTNKSCKYTMLTELTKLRTAQLEEWLSKPQNAECAGTIQ